MLLIVNVKYVEMPLNREQNLIRIHRRYINNLLLSFSALNLEESQPVQTEPPIDG